jgi:UrcA family protein
MSAAATLAQAGALGTTISDAAPAVRVQYADLDLSSEHGALTLYRRIENAAKRVCPPATGLNQRAVRLAEQCIAQAIERAVADVNSPQLARVGALRSRRLSQG